RKSRPAKTDSSHPSKTKVRQVRRTRFETHSPQPKSENRDRFVVPVETVSSPLREIHLEWTNSSQRYDSFLTSTGRGAAQDGPLELGMGRARLYKRVADLLRPRRGAQISPALQLDLFDDGA